MNNVSVVIPTLNERDSLPECLYSLQNQLVSGDEVLVVDGGSDDGTRDFAVESGCKLVEADGTSIGMARNIGTEIANNEIIASIDADSLPPNGWIDRVRENFQDEDLVVLWGTVQDKNGIPIRSIVGKFSSIFAGASGNNTAFRKSAFNELKKKYPDTNFGEDVSIIHRLSKQGKARRDKNLVMVMDMDRRRYQTIPVAGASVASIIAGKKYGGKWGRIAEGIGLGMVGTEMTYEKMSDSPIHHDQLGAITLGASEFVDSDVADDIIGAGLGMIIHHDMTEGLSMLPSKLSRHTDEVIE